MRAKKLTACCMCAVMLLAGVLSGCTFGFQRETQPSSAQSTTVSADSQESTAASESTLATQATQATQAPDTDSQDTGRPSYEDPVYTADPNSCVITVNNKDYKVSVGDTVTYTCYLKTPKKVEDVQAKIIYTGASLRLTETKEEALFPILGSSAVCNTETPNLIKFNAVNLKGFDFTKKAALVTLKFEVTTGVGASVATTIEYLTEEGGKSYVEDCKVEKGVDVKIEETLK